MDVNRVGDREREGRRYCCSIREGDNPWGEYHRDDEGDIPLLFTEPLDAREPDVRWRLYVLEGGEVLKYPLYIHRKSCYLFGRERRIADIPTKHPSCSKQHAVIQYRLVEKDQADGMLKKKISPYIMDLGSTNGTFINNDRIESQCYYELKEKDIIKFGNSSREYVMLQENSAHSVALVDADFLCRRT
ncbi:hypothetical protein MKX03_021105 [Papaver bracteatum]|nr:hypothetical protein MKX03_021105 [Papaver bracteatum]